MSEKTNLGPFSQPDRYRGLEESPFWPTFAQKLVIAIKRRMLMPARAQTTHGTLASMEP
jgi:hypothetical protein